MQNTSFQRAVLHAILYFTLFCAIAAGCDWCKGSVDKSTKITIEQKSPLIPKEEVTAQEANPDEPTKESLDAAGKDKEEGEERDEEEEAIKKILEEAESQPRARTSDRDSVQEEFNNPPIPSAPILDDEVPIQRLYDMELPPPYEEREQHQGKNYLENNSPKSSIWTQCWEKVSQKYIPLLSREIRTGTLKAKYITYSADKRRKELDELEKKRDTYKKVLAIRKYKDKELLEPDQELLEQYKLRDDTQIDSKITSIRFKIIVLKRVIKNSRLDTSTNKDGSSYSKQPYTSVPGHSTTNPEPSAPPSYSSSNLNPNGLYPDPNSYPPPPSYSSNNATSPKPLYPTLDDYR